MSEVILSAEREDVILKLGGCTARVSGGQGVIYLHSDLGTGKITLSRGTLCGLGHAGPVKSPTSTLVEPYGIDELRAYYFDLYRPADAKKLEFFGIRDCFDGSALCLIEWSERSADVLSTTDLGATITAQAGGWTPRLIPHGARSEAWCTTLTMGAWEKRQVGVCVRGRC